MHRMISAVVTLLAVSSCALVQGPGSGVIYTHLKGPVAVTSEPELNGVNRVGEASATIILGLFAFGDASIEAALQHGAKNPLLATVSHVDYEWRQVLGFGRFTVRVYFHEPAEVPLEHHR